MIAEHQGYDVEQEHRRWAELIGFLEKLGVFDVGLQEKANTLLRETEEIIRKTELLIAQRGAFASSVKERLYPEHETV